MSTLSIFETKRMTNGWEQWTGRWRCTVKGESSAMTFDLPGRGGRTTKLAAREIQGLFDDNLTAREIEQMTGCQLRGSI